jgi:hypothetical protein
LLGILSIGMRNLVALDVRPWLTTTNRLRFWSFDENGKPTCTTARGHEAIVSVDLIDQIPDLGVNGAFW